MNWFLDPIQNHYADFVGRATRQQYWMFVLFNVGISIVLAIVDAILGTDSGGVGLLGGIYSLAVLVPSLALGCRRLHDINKSGWYQLVGLIPFLGWIILIVWFAQAGDQQDNIYGPSPYGSAPAAA